MTPPAPELEQVAKQLAAEIADVVYASGIGDRAQAVYSKAKPAILAALTTAVAEANERAHYATGTAELAMKHRDEAEATVERLTGELERQKTFYPTVAGQNIKLREILGEVAPHRLEEVGGEA